MSNRSVRALVAFFIFYVAFGVYLTLQQEQIIYQPFPQDFFNCPALREAKPITYQGTRMYANVASNTPTAILYHGNAGSACDRAFYTTLFETAGYGYLLVEYAGYSNDPLPPSHERIKQDVHNVIAYLEQENLTDVAVIGENSDWGLGVIRVFKDNLVDAGVEVTAFSAERTTTDFTPQLLQLKRAEPPVDFIVDGFTGAGELLMIKQAHELGLAPTHECAILGAGMDTLYPGFWDTVGEAGVYVLSNPAGLPGLPKTSTSEKFTKVFKENHNREPDAVAMEGYDSVMVIAEAVKAADTTESKALIDALENRVNWEGTRGTIKFNKSKEPAWAYHMWMDVPVFIIQYTELNQEPSDAAILWPDQYATVDGYIRPPKQ